MFDLYIFLILLGVGYFFGQLAERRHYKSIKARELESINRPAMTFAGAYQPEEIQRVDFVTGEVSISADYFKSITASILSLVGANIVSFETILDRARREAVLRLKEAAPDADAFIDCRLETSMINGEGGLRKRRGTVSAEVYAYGTAVYLNKNKQAA